MFLALKEMKYAKLRYGLIVGVVFLIAYVVFMLSGLANGLAWEFKQSIVDWNAQSVVLSKDANQTFAASQLKQKNLQEVTASQKAPLGLYSGSLKGKHKQVNVTVFGTSKKAFVLPKVTKGHAFTKQNEIVISQNLADEGYQLGDRVKIGQGDQKLKVVGIFPKTYYSVTPVVYTSLATWRQMKYSGQQFNTTEEQPLSAIALKGKSVVHKKSDLEKMAIDAFINELPGYSAQNLTLDAMIYFLFVVVTAIVGIFMYVLTLQKTAIFGVMKVQGIPNRFIAGSIVSQALIIGVAGVIVAVLMAFITSLGLPAAMPFAVNWQLWGLYSVILVAVTVLGSLFSIRTVAKVDPITAIGG